jgi:hypothetical protein
MNGQPESAQVWLALWRANGGPTASEILGLKQCMHWRRVGMDMLNKMNFTSVRGSLSTTGSDCCSHLFVSASDFLSVISSHKGLALEMLEHWPDVMMSWLQGTSIYKGVMQIAGVVRQHAVLSYLESIWNELEGNSTGKEGPNRKTWREANASELAAIKRFMARHRAQIALFDAYASEIFTVREAAAHSNWTRQASGQDITSSLPQPPLHQPRPKVHQGRALLQAGDQVGTVPLNMCPALLK